MMMPLLAGWIFPQSLYTPVATASRQAGSVIYEGKAEGKNILTQVLVLASA